MFKLKKIRTCNLNILNKKYFTNCTPKYNTDVCIIGGGSIGMTMSNLLTKYKINHLIIEKEELSYNFFNHPKAHFLSPRTVETFKYIDIFPKDYFEDNYLKNINNWRHYRYCEFLLNENSYLCEIDHLKPDLNQKIQDVNIISNAYPMNLGQNKLNKLLYNKNDFKDNYLSGIAIKNFEYLEKENKYLIHTNNSNKIGESTTIKSKIILGCDGSHSVVRRQLKIENKGNKNIIQSFVNAHFKSKELADKLKLINKQSMLHFIFNPKYVCVLISYDMDEGEFVLQIPYFPEVESEKDFTKNECERILRELFSNDKDIKFWKMKNVVVDKWYQDRIFILGDAAHQFPPSGGYGLNMGVADAFSLAWRLKYILEENKEINPNREYILKETFQNERIIHSNFVSKCAASNYDKFLQSCKTLNLNIDHSNILQQMVKNVVPKTYQRSIFNKFMNTGIFMSNLFFSQNLKFHLKELKNHIKLIFPYLDYGLNYKRKDENKIEKYENTIEINDIKITEGAIIQNYSIKNIKIRLRETMKQIQDNYDFPLFFVISNLKKEEINFENILLFENKINLNEFKFVFLENNLKSFQNSAILNKIGVADFFIEELNCLKLVVIRPDFIIEYIQH